MASTGYEIDEGPWLEEIQKLTSSPETFLYIHWSFGTVRANRCRFVVDGRTIRVLIPQGSAPDIRLTCINVNLPDLGVRYIRKVDEHKHVLLIAHARGEYVCFSDSWDTLDFEGSEVLVQ